MGNTKYFLDFYLIEWVLPTVDIVIVFIFNWLPRSYIKCSLYRVFKFRK